nr:MAG TPA: hypothetical protein [Bacteriophage sp.]
MLTSQLMLCQDFSIDDFRHYFIITIPILCIAEFCLK